MKSAKQANPRRSVALKALLVYLAVAVLVLFVSSLIGFYLGGPDGATFALGIGVLINLLVFPVVGLRLMARLKAMASEEPTLSYAVAPRPTKQVDAHETKKSKMPPPHSEKPSA